MSSMVHGPTSERATKAGFCHRTITIRIFSDIFSALSIGITGSVFQMFGMYESVLIKLNTDAMIR